MTAPNDRPSEAAEYVITVNPAGNGFAAEVRDWAGELKACLPGHDTAEAAEQAGLAVVEKLIFEDTDALTNRGVQHQ